MNKKITIDIKSIIIIILIFIIITILGVNYAVSQVKKINVKTSVSELQNNLRDIAQERTPAVVNIRSEIEFEQIDNPFSDMFQDFTDEDREKYFPEYQEAFGSGFIISEDGYIVTNDHVVKGALNITVILWNNKEYEAEIIGEDPKTDIALLKIETDIDLPVLPLGNSDDIRVGDIAVAIGNPFGLNGSFTMGVISAVGRDSDIDTDAPFKSYIQTDASINQGNSGGPLLNIQGEVIGMNTAIYSTTGGSIGIGFALPVNIISKVVKELSEKGVVERPMLGITVMSLDEEMANIFNIEEDKGAIINDVLEDSPAYLSGLKPMDVIIKIDDNDIKNSNDVVKNIITYDIGDVVSLRILRLKDQDAPEEIVIDVKLGLRNEKSFENIHIENDDNPQTKDSKNIKKWLGMSIANLSRYKTKSNAEGISRGILIMNVLRNSSAYKKGLQKGMVISIINGVEVKNIDDIKKIKRTNQFLIKIHVGKRSTLIVIGE